MRQRRAVALELVAPGLGRLPSYVAALERGWSPTTTRDVSGEHLASIHADAQAFVDDRARHEGGTVPLRDGTPVPRLPGRVFWIWDGAFCGVIDLRFVPGSLDLPPHVSGHLGYAVVPWKQHLGYATQALALLLPVAAALRLPRVLVTCDVANGASRRVIEANGGVFAGEEDFLGDPAERKLLFWIETTPSAASFD